MDFDMRDRRKGRDHDARFASLDKSMGRPAPVDVARLGVAPVERPVVRRLSIGRADDRAELEADRFAAQLAGPPTTIGVHSGPTRIHRRSAHGSDRLGGTDTSPEVTSRIQSMTGGATLPADIRRRAETQSGRDLSAVRLHTGREADELSRSVDAMAFTTGTDIFFSRDAARPGSAAGNDVLAHELGHVVQQGGGSAVQRIRRAASFSPLQRTEQPTAQRIRRAESLTPMQRTDNPPVQRVQRTDSLAPLQRSTQPTVQRLLGKSKSKIKSKQHNPAAVADNKALLDDRKRLRKELDAYEASLKKLRKAEASQNARSAKGKKPSANSPDRAVVSWEIVKAANTRLQAMPGGQGKSAEMLGIAEAFADERTRLRRVLEQANLIYDEHRVAMTKQAAEEIYVNAGRAAGDATTGGGEKAFANLSTKTVFAEKPSSDLAKAIHAAGHALGLSPAEVAAIATFTGSDYHYMNPATANDDAWMGAMFPTTDAAEAQNRKEEGSLHSSMAVKGLLKLPAWKGSTVRGETKSLAEFNRDFIFQPRSGGRRVPLALDATDDWMERKIAMNQFLAAHDIKIAKNTFTTKPLMSTSKLLTKAAAFGAESDSRPLRCMFHFTLINGRDVESLSVNTGEAEVVVLPGATFAYKSIEYVPTAGRFEIHAKQLS